MPLRNTEWPSIDPGEFRHLVTFLDQVIGSDASGAKVDWLPASPPVTGYFKIEPIRGIDLIKAGQDTSQVFVMITGYFIPGVLPNKRVSGPTGSQYVIQAIENVMEMSVYMVLTCVGLGSNL